MPPAALVWLQNKLAQIVRGGTATESVRRRRALKAKLASKLLTLRLLLLLVGYVWLLALPFIPDLSRRTYIDENALQPSLVNTYWSWTDVQRADMYLAQIERMHAQNASSAQYAEFAVNEFRKLGLASSTQQYSYTTSAGQMKSGVNAYALSSSPRASGAEAIVISASWLSCIDEGHGSPNHRGVATVLSMAAFLKQYSHWAKDLVFVISDGYLEGMHAWLSAYHHSTPQNNMQYEELEASPGVIWTALNIDYPGHSFSHLGAFHEGLNGRLPNQDLYNSLQLISQHTAGVPVVLYNHTDLRPINAETSLWRRVLDPLSQRDNLKESFKTWDNIERHMSHQTLGRPSGVHGLFHPYRIDAVTLFAVPANGPHGFHSIGRILESTLRTANNLLEKLHASFFFYILTGPGMFMKIGSYLPSAILISVSLMLGGLQEYSNAGWTPTSTGSIQRRHPVLQAIAIMASLHVAFGAMFVAVADQHVAMRLGAGLVHLTSLWALSRLRISDDKAPLAELLKALNLCVASTVITIASLLNFSLAATIALHLGVPLTLSRRWGSPSIGTLMAGISGLYSLSWLLSPDRMIIAFREWTLFGNWFAPFVGVVYLPLVFQSLLVSFL